MAANVAVSTVTHITRKSWPEALSTPVRHAPADKRRTLSRATSGRQRCLEIASGSTPRVRGGTHPVDVINSCALCSAPTPVHTSGANRYCPACLPIALADRPQVASVRKPTGSTRLTKGGTVIVKSEFGWVPKPRAIVEAYLGSPLPPGHRVMQLQPRSEPHPENLAVKATGGPAVPLAEFAALHQAAK